MIQAVDADDDVPFRRQKRHYTDVKFFKNDKDVTTRTK